MSNRAPGHFNLLHRYVLVIQLLAQRPAVTSIDIREHLAANGHDISLRTVQHVIEDMRIIGIIEWQDNRHPGRRRPLYSLSEHSPVRAAA